MTIVFTEDDPRLKFIPMEKAIVPPEGLIKHIKNCWWIVHPTKGVVFYTGNDKRFLAPQANGNEEIAERILSAYSWAELKFIPSVFHRIKPDDYVY